MVKFADRLAELRNEAGITQTDFAAKIGFNRSTITGYENMGREPSFENLSKIADFFNVSADYLLGRTSARRENINISLATSGAKLEYTLKSADRYIAEPAEKALELFYKLLDSYIKKESYNNVTMLVTLFTQLK